MRFINQLRLRFITTLFSYSHKHGKLRLEVHIIEHLLWLVVCPTILLLLLRRLVQLLTVILLICCRLDRVMLLACRTSCILHCLDVLASLVTMVMLGVRRSLALRLLVRDNTSTCLIHHLVIRSLTTFTPIRRRLLGQTQTTLCCCRASEVLASLCMSFSSHRCIICDLSSRLCRFL